MNLLQSFSDLLFLVGLGVVARLSAERQRPRYRLWTNFLCDPLPPPTTSAKPLANKSATSSRTFLGMGNDPESNVSPLSITTRELGNGSDFQITLARFIDGQSSREMRPFFTPRLSGCFLSVGATAV